MCPSAPRVCSEPGGQRPVLSLSLDLIDSSSAPPHRGGVMWSGPWGISNIGFITVYGLNEGHIAPLFGPGGEFIVVIIFLVVSHIFLQFQESGIRHNMGKLSENLLELKSCKTLLLHNIDFIYSIILKFCTRHNINIAILSAKCQNDWTMQDAFMERRNFVTFTFQMHFWWDFPYWNCPQGVRDPFHKWIMSS